jgi:hypothetical protein
MVEINMFTYLLSQKKELVNHIIYVKESYLTIGIQNIFRVMINITIFIIKTEEAKKKYLKEK